MVAKVSAVYSKGTSHGTYTGIGTGIMSISGRNISELSQRLAPPPKPEFDNTGCFIFLLIITAIVTTIGFLSSLGSLISISIRESISINTVIVDTTISTTVYLAIIVGIITGIRKLNSYVKKNRIKYEIDKGKWNNKMNNWQKLYYCFKDDVVFYPDSNEYIKPEDIRNHI